jgi:hypothetical protein
VAHLLLRVGALFGKNSDQPRFHIKSEVSCGVRAPIFFQHVQGFSKERLGLTIPAQYVLKKQRLLPIFSWSAKSYTFCPTTVNITHRFC